jgi:hypothetical protein
MTGKKGNRSAIGRVLDVLTIAGGPDRKGEYQAFCPAHDDRKTPNLRIREAEDGRVLLRCFAGCGQDKVLSALTKKGIGKSDLFARNGRGGGRGSTTTQDHVHACTLEAYAEAKKLPVEFLARLGLSDTSYVGKPAVRILYLGEDGSEGAVRFRIALEKGPKGDERFRWRKGSKPSLYGLWRLEHAHDEGYIFLVEGESDAQTLWHRAPGQRRTQGFRHLYTATSVERKGMANQPWLNEIASKVDHAQQLYHRLIILIGGTGACSIVADHLGLKRINVSMQLGERLLNLSAQRRPLQVGGLLANTRFCPPSGRQYVSNNCVGTTSTTSSTKRWTAIR